MSSRSTANAIALVALLSWLSAIATGWYVQHILTSLGRPYVVHSVTVFLAVLFLPFLVMVSYFAMNPSEAGVVGLLVKHSAGGPKIVHLRSLLIFLLPLYFPIFALVFAYPLFLMIRGFFIREIVGFPPSASALSLVLAVGAAVLTWHFLWRTMMAPRRPRTSEDDDDPYRP